MKELVNNLEWARSIGLLVSSNYDSYWVEPSTKANKHKAYFNDQKIYEGDLLNCLWACEMHFLS